MAASASPGDPGDAGELVELGGPVDACVRLPQQFDPAGLAADLARVPEGAWTPHFNSQIYEGDWSGAALRAVPGALTELYPDPTSGGSYADTALLAGSPHFAAVLAALPCPLQSARLLRVGPGSQILPHHDLRLGYEDGEVRLHVPVATDPAVEFVVDGSVWRMAAGECWYVNVNRTHSVVNRSGRARVHLVVDCVVDDWLDHLIVDAAASPERDADRV